MTADAEDSRDERRRRWWERRRWRALVALLIVFAVALGALWTQRRPIANRFVDRELARRGVPARYTIDRLGLSSQRLTNVVLGDPRDPDLVADWVIVRTRVGLSGAAVEGIEAGRVRMRARLVDRRLSLGAIDRLLPPPSGKPFALPALDTRLEDVRLRIETPQGVVGARLSGRGRLDDGFAGRLALVSRGLAAGNCRLDQPRAALAVRISRARPTIEGPARIAEARCADVAARAVTADVRVTFGAALDRWSGQVRAASTGVTAPGAATGHLLARVGFDGTAQATVGDMDATAMQARIPQARAAMLRLNGRYRVGSAGSQFAGHVGAEHTRLSDATLAPVTGLAKVGAGTPVAPLAAALARASAAAGHDLTVETDIEAVTRGSARAIRLRNAALSAASGARATIGGRLLRFGAVEIGGQVRLGGGGLPQATVDLRRQRDGMAGRAVVAPYAAGGARLALTPADFSVAGGGLTRVTTTATLTGPLADGRVEALTVPITAAWGAGGLLVNTACTPVSWSRLSVSSLTLNATRLTLCPIDRALVTRSGARLGGGARIAAPRLSGRIGATPLALSAADATLQLTGLGFSLSGVQARLGEPGRVTRIDAGQLSGAIVSGVAAGRFAEGGGQIGNVPLLLSAAAGTWRFAGGRLALGGGLTVSDAATERRFEPLSSRDVVLTLVGNRIDATATLQLPARAVTVAAVRIGHDLASGTGEATLDVPGLTFGKTLQPNELTPITFGVIADVQGAVRGRGLIRWTAGGVTSTGRFSTDGIDLAAAFGPVTGIRGEIAFTDLLGLVTAPTQVATIETVNPGIAVENGTVRYRLIGDNRVQVEGGYWPFANGRLVLEPTLLDFNANQLRRMTFRVDGADAATFLQQFDFENLNATGTFDGVLPMTFDESGGRIEDGRLAARGGGNLAYVGTITEKDVGVWGNIAFQALKSLNYRNLDITLNGPLAGEMVTGIRFAGVSQGAGTKSNFIIRRLARLPLVFNITIRAPFRQLVDSVRSYYDPSRLIERNLPALMEERRRREKGLLPTPPAIQPPDSEKRP